MTNSVRYLLLWNHARKNVLVTGRLGMGAAYKPCCCRKTGRVPISGRRGEPARDSP